MPITQEYLDTLFPASKNDEFFEALFGDPDDGAYDISLALKSQDDTKILIDYELHVREGQCLACNLTSGLPNVLKRHPIIAASQTVEALAKTAGWQEFSYEIGETNQLSEELHTIPLTITKG